MYIFVKEKKTEKYSVNSEKSLKNIQFKYPILNDKYLYVSKEKNLSEKQSAMFGFPKAFEKNILDLIGDKFQFKKIQVEKIYFNKLLLLNIYLNHV